MHYKTIILEMLRDRPLLHEELRRTRRLPTAMEQYATELRERHLAWKATLLQQRPGSHPTVIASEAMERAIEELANRLPCGSRPTETEDAEPAEPNPASSFPA